MKITKEAIEAAEKVLLAETLGAEWAPKLARLALHAAQPHLKRTITTRAGLDALPTGTIVQDAYAVACQRTSKYLNHEWERMGHVHPHRPYLPADVIWEPEA